MIGAPSIVVRVGPSVASSAIPLSPQQQQREALVNVLYRHGLLHPGGGNAPTQQRLSVGTTSTSSSATLPTASLQMMEQGLPMLFPSPTSSAAGILAGAKGGAAKQPPPIPCDFIHLTIEMMRVVREVTTPLRSDVSHALSMKPELSPASAQHIVSRYTTKMGRVSSALRIMEAVFNHDQAFLSERDSVSLCQFGADLELILMGTKRHDEVVSPGTASFRRSLAFLWWCLAACLGAAESKGFSTSTTSALSPDVVVTTSAAASAGVDVGNICTMILKSLSSERAWYCSGMTLYLTESYIFAVAKVCRLLLGSVVLQRKFDNTQSVVAKLVIERLGRRPPLTLSGCTSRRSPTPSHGAIYIAHCLNSRLNKYIFGVDSRSEAVEPSKRELLRGAVKIAILQQRSSATEAAGVPTSNSNGSTASLFQWIAYASICEEAPPDLTLDPEALRVRAEKSELCIPSNLVAPSLLQTLVALCLQYSGVRKELSQPVLLTMFDSVTAEALQLKVTSPADVRSPIHSINVPAVLKPVLVACEEVDIEFYVVVLKRIQHAAAHAYKIVLDASNTKTNKGSANGSLQFIEFGFRVSRAFWSFMTLHPLERMTCDNAWDMILAMSWILPLFALYIPTLPNEKDRMASAKLRSAMESTVTSLAGKVNEKQALELVVEASRLSSQSQQLRNPVFSARLETLLVALRSPTLCARISADQIVAEWGNIVLPCLMDCNQPSLALMTAAHDVLIAPILAKVNASIVFVPTYVSMFCPVNGSNPHYKQPHNALARVFATKVRQVAESLETMDPPDLEIHDQGTIGAVIAAKKEKQIGTPASTATGNTGSGGIATVASDALKELSPLSATLLIVQGVFDQVRLLAQRAPLSKADEERKASYTSALLNLLQCSNPLITSRVCACVEVVVLQLLAQKPAEQERVLAFSASVIGTTMNYSMKKPLGEWLLRLADECRQQRQARGSGVKSKL